MAKGNRNELLHIKTSRYFQGRMKTIMSTEIGVQLHFIFYKYPMNYE